MEKIQETPKVIHYVWVGGIKKPKQVVKVIDSWKKFAPDYKLVEWNEDNFDISQNDFATSAYRAKNYAFVSDYIRVEVLHKYGGIYLDTDMLMIAPIDEWLTHDYELQFANFSDRQFFGAGFIYAIPNQNFLTIVSKYYKDKEKYTIETLPNTVDLSELFNQYMSSISTDEMEKINIFSNDELYNPSGNSKIIHRAMTSWSKRDHVKIWAKNRLRNFVTTKQRALFYEKAVRLLRRKQYGE